MVSTALSGGDRKPNDLVALTVELVGHLLEVDDPLHIAVLAPFVATAKALQRGVFQTYGYRKNILVETVSKVQGLTTDVTIYAVPNTQYTWSLEPRLFNVATSRARRHTIIITDNDLLKGAQMDQQVRRYLTQLSQDFAFVVDAPSMGGKGLLGVSRQNGAPGIV